MNFAVNLIFLIKLLFLHDQKLNHKQKRKYLDNEKSFYDEIKKSKTIFLECQIPTLTHQVISVYFYLEF